MNTSHLTYRLLLGIAAGCLVPQASAQQWQQVEESSYVCGGVAQEGMEQIRAMRDAADVELLFTQGPRGAWKADVDVSVAGAGAQPLQFTADGPACLLKLPPGEYTIQAEAGGVTRTQRLSTEGPVKRVMFNWPD